MIWLVGNAREQPQKIPWPVLFLLHRVKHCLPAVLLPARRHGEGLRGSYFFSSRTPPSPPWAGLTHGGVEDQEAFFLPSSTCTLLILLFPIPTVKIPYPSSVSSLLLTVSLADPTRLPKPSSHLNIVSSSNPAIPGTCRNLLL